VCFDGKAADRLADADVVERTPDADPAMRKHSAEKTNRHRAPPWRIVAASLPSASGVKFASEITTVKPKIE
jgi:hypothetical protein